MQLASITLAFYMFLGSLFPLNDFSQIVKLQSLIDHFQHHLEEHGKNVSFISFLRQHFISLEDHYHENGQDHEDLPLQSINSTVTGIFKWSTLDLVPVPVTVHEDPNTYIELKPSLFTAVLLRPPNV